MGLDRTILAERLEEGWALMCLENGNLRETASSLRVAYEKLRWRIKADPLESHSGGVILQLLREAVGQAREPAHGHAHGEFCRST
jgi:hypothetical protein